MISSDLRDIWCTLSDKNDLEYLEVEREQGEDIQVNVKVAGIYKLIFDTVTKSFDIEYKSEITVPVYEEILACEIGVLNASSNLEFIEMQKVGEELVATNLHIIGGKAVGFYSKFTHTSWYKVTVDENCSSNIVYSPKTEPSTYIFFMFNGTYNVYLNPKTYVVRAELVSVDENGYSIMIFENSGENFLSLADESVKHVFIYQMVVESKIVGTTEIVVEDVPTFYNGNYHEYDLQIAEDSLQFFRISDDYAYFKEKGTYNLLIDLQTFTISVEKLPE